MDKWIKAGVIRTFLCAAFQLWADYKLEQSAQLAVEHLKNAKLDGGSGPTTVEHPVLLAMHYASPVVAGGLLLSAVLIAFLLKRTPASAIALDERRIDPAFQSELDRLNPYQLLAVKQLVARGGMTGKQFSDQLYSWGFPFSTVAQETAIGTVFDVINRETTLLTLDNQSLWNLRNREVVARILHL